MQRTFNKAERKPYFRNGKYGSNNNGVIWTPSYLTTALWLDAADNSTITLATGVSQWSDKSTNGRNATQGTAANQPVLLPLALNGKNVVGFDGSNDSLAYTGTFFANTSYSIHSVVARRSNASNNWYMGGSGNTANSNLLLGWTTDTVYRFAQYNNDIDATVTGYSSPTYEIWGTALDTGVGRSIYRNGTLANSNATKTALSSNAGSTIGSSPVSSTWFNGDIAEIIVTTSVLSTTDRQKIEGYLAHKWGLTGNLPSDHPYKVYPPQK